MAENDLDDLQKKYAALGLTDTTPKAATALPWFMRDAATASASTTGGTIRDGSNLDELQRQYAALGFSEAQTPVRPDTGVTIATADSRLATPAAPATLASPSASSGAQLDDLQEQYDNLFKERPPALDLENGESSMQAVQTPDSSSASTGNAGITRSAGGIDEFAMYQRFRLHMVKMFGSLSSALFELGADPETGITRAAFVDVLSTRLQLFSRSDANSLFSHATNADVMEYGLGGVATWRDFGISEHEWRTVVSAKQDPHSATAGGRMPFQSGPTGVSLGIYHRTVKLEDVLGPSPCKGSPTAEPMVSTPTTTPQGGTGTKGSPRKKALHSRPLRRALLKTGERVWPWRLPQKPWAPSTLSGQSFLEEANMQLAKSAANRSRMNELSFRGTPRATSYEQSREAQMLSEQLDPTDKPHRTGCAMDLAAGHALSTIPSSRSEFEPSACVRQVASWWPYQRTAPPPKLRSVLPPLPKRQTSKAEVPVESDRKTCAPRQKSK